MRLFLDLDDVLNSLTLHILHRLGCPVEKYDYHRFPVECGYDIVGAFNKLRPPDVKPLDPEGFWDDVITQEFWAQAPLSREAYFILTRAADIAGKENVYILTKPTKRPDSLAGKAEWIQHTMPDWLQDQYLIGPPKQACSYPDAVLIDDSDFNVQKFRKAGGKAVLVPRPWNSLRDHNTTAYLDRAFRTLESMKGFE